MKKYFLTLFVISFSFSFAQKLDISQLNKEEKAEFAIGNTLFTEKNYAPAYAHLRSIQANHQDNLYFKYMVGVCGIFVHGIHEEALSFLQEVKSKEPKAKNIDLYLTLLYHKNYQFDKAIESANQLLSDPKLDPDQKNALQQVLTYSKNGKAVMENPVVAKIENLGSPPNSEAAEYSPVVTSDEEEIIFTYRGKESMGGMMDANQVSSKNGEYFEDVFLSKKIDHKWQKAEPITSINTKDNDAAIAFSNDQKQLYLYKYDDNGKGDIYVSEFNNDKFSKPEIVKGINTKSWEGSLSLSVDQSKLYFSSDRPGGKGGKDLYVATKMPDGSWGNIKNMGDKINTTADEDAPFIHPDGRTLVFSSDGHNTIGDFDIFASDLDILDSTWKAPYNLGYPINTTDDDLFYILSADGQRGYFSSEKKGGAGEQDIYVVTPSISSKKTFLTVIKGKVTEDLFPYSADVTVVVSSDGRKYTAFRSNPESGHYLVNLPSGYNYKVTFFHKMYGEKNFEILADKIDGYAEKIVNVNFGMSDTSSTSTQTIVIKNIDVTGNLLLTENSNDIAKDVKVYLLNPDGTLLDSARTNANGHFEFKNLPSDKNYMVSVVPEDPSMKGKARFYLSNNAGVVSRVSNIMDNHRFVFKNLPLDVNSLPELYGNDPMTLAGKVTYGEDPGKPFKNVRVSIVNQYGDVLVWATTNQYGAFAFKNLPADQNYIITIDDTDLKLPPNTKVSLKNKNGKEIKSFYTKDGKYNFTILATEKSVLSDLDAGDAELMMGLYGYVLGEDKKPLDDLKLMLLNMNGEVDQTIKTDAKGKFAFKNLKAAADYLFDLDENDPRFKTVQRLYIADSKGRLYKELIRNLKGKFEFRILDIDKIALGEFYYTEAVPAKPVKEKPVKEVAVKEKPMKDKMIIPNSGSVGINDDQIVQKYGNVKVEGMKVNVQVGAYRKPENFKSKFLQKICGFKLNGKRGDITFIVADKEFETLKEAQDFQIKIQKAGISDAFLTANYKGKRYYLKELEDMGVFKQITP
jgi:tetratricopeptide (TPR) repeat protein